MKPKPFRKRLFAAAGYTTTFFGPGRQEFNPAKPMPSFEEYLIETAQGTAAQLSNREAIDEGVIANFMAPRFLKQGNLPGFLPFMLPELKGKPCTAVEGACGSGGRAIYTAMKSILSDLSDVVFVAGFEIQNTVKSVYGADVLAGAAYYNGERKDGFAFFFPGIFADRTGAYYEKYGTEKTREAMARWYEQSILNSRKNPKAQEYHNTTKDLYQTALTPPNKESFIPHLNLFNCSKISDGATSLIIASEEGLKKLGIPLEKAVELIAVGATEGDITQKPSDPTKLDTTQKAVQKAFEQAGIAQKDLGVLELHDCFAINALLALEACGLAKPGGGADYILEGHTRAEGSLPTNPSGGLIGFGHPTGASGVRQLVDLLLQFTGEAANPVNPKTPYGMLISMGGNDKTVTALIVKQLDKTGR